MFAKLRPLLFACVSLPAFQGCAGNAGGVAAPPLRGDSPWALHGHVVGEEGAKPAWIVVRGGAIDAVVEDEAALPRDIGRKTRFDGYVFPGLIDTHNHVSWNVMPGRSLGSWSHRFEWQKDPQYLKDVYNTYYRTVHHRGLTQAATLYGEIRAIIGGTTLIQSSYAAPEPDVLIRNLDRTHGSESITFPLLLEEAKVRGLVEALENGSLRRLFVHLAEGPHVDPKFDEFKFLKESGLLRKGVVVIHGLGLSDDQMKEVIASGMFLVWSPQSNWSLYRKTVDFEAFSRKGLTISIAPDWSITGSDNVLEELRFAESWVQSKTARPGKIQSPPGLATELFKMATVNAAKVCGLEDRVGRIAPGYFADFFLADRKETQVAPGEIPAHNSLLRTYPRDIRLVFVNGRALYGDIAMLEQWTDAREMDPLQVQGTPKGIVLTKPDRKFLEGIGRWPELVKKLSESVPRLAELVED